MEIRVGLVLELPRHPPAMRLGKLDGLVDHADRALGRRRDHDLGAEEAHQLAPLDAESLRHGDDQRIALGGADHRKANAGVAAGRLDHGLARLQLAGFLRGLDHAEREAVFHRTERVEGFHFHEQVHAFGREPVDPHHGRVADGFENALVFLAHGAYSRLRFFQPSFSRPTAPNYNGTGGCGNVNDRRGLRVAQNRQTVL